MWYSYPRQGWKVFRGNPSINSSGVKSGSLSSVQIYGKSCCQDTYLWAGDWDVNDARTRCRRVAPVPEQVAELHRSDLPPILRTIFACLVLGRRMIRRGRLDFFKFGVVKSTWWHKKYCMIIRTIDSLRASTRCFHRRVGNKVYRNFLIQ